MVLLGAVILGLLLGLARGGRFGNLAEVSFQWGLVAPLALAAQLLAVQVLEDPGFGIRWWVMLLSYAALLGVAWRNWSHPGVWLVTLGLFLNGLVILVNGGAMPITPETAKQIGVLPSAVDGSVGVLLQGAKDIILPQVDTRLWILSDIGFLPMGSGVAFSIGDLVLGTGIVRVIEASMRRLPDVPRASEQARDVVSRGAGSVS